MRSQSPGSMQLDLEDHGSYLESRNRRLRVTNRNHIGSAAAFAQSPASSGTSVWVTPSLANNGGGKILITGAADFGITKGRNYNHAVLKKGTLTVNLKQFNAAGNSANPTVNPSTCSGVLLNFHAGSDSERYRRLCRNHRFVQLDRAVSVHTAQDEEWLVQHEQ